MNCNENERLILPDDKCLQYMGRIDDRCKTAPVLVFPYTMIRTRFTGRSVRIWLKNHRGCWDNYLGFIIDGIQKKLKLPYGDEESCLTLADNLDNHWHELTVFKRMDSCHTITFLGLCIEKDASLGQPEAKPDRRIEVYGDSVSAGEVSEAIDYVGMADPEHQGEYSNSWYSYAAIAARQLNAQLHDIAQGGAALLNHTGWFAAPHYIGMEEIWDKVQYNPETGPVIRWDFGRYTPHVVIAAIGQNDNHPKDYMAVDDNGPAARRWKARYGQFLRDLRGKYPRALIILTTTILIHDRSWDKAIDQVCREINDDRIVHFLYKRNGTGTPGHIRIPEAREMAGELVDYINTFGDALWQEK